MPDRVLHLAIPTHDLEAAEGFYGRRLGCRIARRYEDRITLDFFGMQLVCHLAPDAVDAEPRMYPRHFGVTLRDRDAFDAVLARLRDAEVPFFREPFTRFAGRPDSHRTFFVRDPSNNVVEFKHYDDPAMMF